jgi:dihydrofolate reductase/thymidylate synthase
MEKIPKKKLYYDLVLAMSKNKGIGKNNKLPWSLPTDMQFFHTVTTKVLNKSESINRMISENFIKSSKNVIFELFEDSKKTQKKFRKKNITVMGRLTWESIPNKFKPLKNRINIVLSKNPEFHKNNPTIENVFYSVNSVEEFFELAEKLDQISLVGKIYVIGGSQIYKEFLEKFPDNFNLLFQTNIEKDYDCDSFFETPKDLIPLFVSKTIVDEKEPEVSYDFRIFANNMSFANLRNNNELIFEKEENEKNINLSNSEFSSEISINDDSKTMKKPKYTYMNLSSIIDPYFFSIHPPHEELQYLDAIRDIISTGVDKSDRTGIGTISKFGYTMKFDCSKSFPLLTTKDTFWRGIVEELIWFINGDTNVKNLQSKKIHFWDGNASREYLDNIGLSHREEGDLGPVYGFQWRYSGAEYKTMHDDYTGHGVDQLMNVINDINNNPNSRRIIMCAWNPKDLNLMALPPCHVLCQFYIENNDKLSLQMYQRSADMGLGVPFNIASYALLLNMVAQVTNKKVGNYIHTIGDAHVYKNHVEALQKQLERIPRAFPILKINKEVEAIDKFKFSDFQLIGYNPYPKIKMDMAV